MLNLTGGGLLVFVVLAAAALFSPWLYTHTCILEIDRPVSGLMIVSSEPIQHALSAMRR